MVEFQFYIHWAKKDKWQSSCLCKDSNVSHRYFWGKTLVTEGRIYGKACGKKDLWHSGTGKKASMAGVRRIGTMRSSNKSSNWEKSYRSLYILPLWGGNHYIASNLEIIWCGLHFKLTLLIAISKRDSWESREIY